jgi:hypothetical protein
MPDAVAPEREKSGLWSRIARAVGIGGAKRPAAPEVVDLVRGLRALYEENRGSDDRPAAPPTAEGVYGVIFDHGAQGTVLSTIAMNDGTTRLLPGVGAGIVLGDRFPPRTYELARDLCRKAGALLSFLPRDAAPEYPAEGRFRVVVLTLHGRRSLELADADFFGGKTPLAALGRGYAELQSILIRFIYESSVEA